MRHTGSLDWTWNLLLLVVWEILFLIRHHLANVLRSVLECCCWASWCYSLVVVVAVAVGAAVGGAAAVVVVVAVAVVVGCVHHRRGAQSFFHCSDWSQS